MASRMIEIDGQTYANPDYVDAGAKPEDQRALDLQSSGWISADLGINPNLNQYWSGGNGMKFNNTREYLEWLYGPGQYQDQNGEMMFKPDGGLAPLPGKTPLSYNPPDSSTGDLTKLALAGIIGAGAYSGAFGGLGAGAGSTGMSAADIASQLASLEGGVAAGGAGAGTGGALSGLAEFAVPGANAATEAALFGAPNSLAGAVGTSIPGISTGTTAGLAAGLGGASGAFNVADYITSGTGGTGTPPTLPSASGIPNAVSATSALSRIWDQLNGKGEASSADWLETLGKLGATGLGVYGANKQAGDLNDLSNKMFGEGQWARDAFKGTFAPGYDLSASDPGFKGALDQSAQTAARSWSARAGNPADNPGAQAEIQKYVLNSSYLPQLNTTRSQLINAGGMGFDSGARVATGAIDADKGTYNALGYGLNQLTQPQGSLEELLKRSGIKLSMGNSF